MDHSDSLSTSTLRSLDHDGEANLLRTGESVLPRLNAGVVVRTVGDGDEPLGRHDGVLDAGSGPGHAGDLGRLGDDGRRDLVS